MNEKASSQGKTGRRHFFYALLILLATFGVFNLDLLTKDSIAFDIFYFPFVMLMAWFFGKRAGYLMAFLTGAMWFLAQEDATSWKQAYLLIDDGLVHLVTFLLVCGMTALVRKQSLQLQEKTRELARSNLELEQFAYKAAHDLQAPLASIFSYAEYLGEKGENSPPEEKLTLCADAILKGIKRMSLLIKALLDYSRVSKTEGKVLPVDLGKTVQEAVENLHATIAEKKAEVTADPLPLLPVPPGLAGILFQNLIGNALKYCEKVPRVHVSAVRKGKEWLFSVRDNGIGIPPESRERVFVMFEKLATRQQYPGSGIGLATCQRIVERYGGRIWVEPVPEGGSVFYFTFPALP